MSTNLGDTRPDVQEELEGARRGLDPFHHFHFSLKGVHYLLQTSVGDIRRLKECIQHLRCVFH